MAKAPVAASDYLPMPCPIYGEARGTSECEKCGGDIVRCPVYGPEERRRQAADRGAATESESVEQASPGGSSMVTARASLEPGVATPPAAPGSAATTRGLIAFAQDAEVSAGRSIPVRILHGGVYYDAAIIGKKGQTFQIATVEPRSEATGAVPSFESLDRELRRFSDA